MKGRRVARSSQRARGATFAELSASINASVMWAGVSLHRPPTSGCNAQDARQASRVVPGLVSRSYRQQVHELF